MSKKKNSRAKASCLRAATNKIIVKPDPFAEKTQGGIFIPSVAQDHSPYGTVVAVGTFKHKQDYKAGDRVLLSPTAGLPFIHENELHLTLRKEDIWGVVE